MTYYIIEKIEAFGGQLQRVPVGVTTNNADADQINQGYCQGFGCWKEENKRWLETGQISPAEYFKNNPPVLVAEWQTDTIEGLKIEQWQL